MKWFSEKGWPYCALLVLAAAAAACWPRGLALSVTDAEGETVFSRAVSRHERFAIRFVHSYARSPVEEEFEIIGPRDFRLRETRYADFGAGLPHEETAGLKMTFGDGRIRITGYDVKFAELQLRVGRIAEHALIVGDAAPERFDRWIRPGGEARVTVTEAPGGFASWK